MLHNDRLARRAALVLVCVGLAGGWLLGDRVLAPRLLPPQGYFVKPPGEVWVEQVDESVLPGVSGDSTRQFTADGLRADPYDPADRYRLLCIGGSTTECAVLDDQEAWPHRLQDALRRGAPELHAWVGNAGGSGHNSRQHILVTEHVLPRVPACDAVIHLLGINDLMHRIARDESFVPLTPEQILDDAASLNLAFCVHPDRDSYLPWFKRTNTWRLGRMAKRTLAARRNAPELARVSHYDWSTQLARLQERRRTQMTELKELPDMTSALEEFERNLRYLIAQARERQVRIIFMTQPTFWRPGLSAAELYRLTYANVGRDPFQATEYYGPGPMGQGIAMYNATTLRVCAEEQAECLDLASRIPKTLDYFYDDCHFNEAGAALVGKIVADYLMATPPFSAASASSSATAERGSSPGVSR